MESESSKSLHPHLSSYGIYLIYCDYCFEDFLIPLPDLYGQTKENEELEAFEFRKTLASRPALSEARFLFFGKVRFIL